MFEAIDPVSWSRVRRPCRNGREEVRARGGAASEAAAAAAIFHLRSRPVRLLCQQAVHALKELEAWRRVAYALGRIEDALHELRRRWLVLGVSERRQHLQPIHRVRRLELRPRELQLVGR